jgi:hypothetical protein
LALAIALTTTPAFAQGTPDCAPVVAAISSIEGYEAAIPPAAPDGDWCVLDGSRLRSTAEGRPDLALDVLRIRQTATAFDIDLRGLRAAPRPSDRDMDDRLRSMLRLQSADLNLRARHDAATNRVTVSEFRLVLSGGTALDLSCDIQDADLSAAGLAAGRLTRASLVWRSDGRFLRPVMDMAGEGLAGAPGGPAVDAARAALEQIVDLLPPATLDDASRKALAAAIRSLPQGRGKLTLTLVSEDGIGAARLGMAALAGDPLSPKAMAALFDGVTLAATWTPGLAD